MTQSKHKQGSKELEVGVRYVVLRGSSGTLCKGDKISLQENGDLVVHNAFGWLEKEYADEVIPKIRVCLDTQYYKNVWKSSVTELHRLESILKTAGVSVEDK